MGIRLKLDTIQAMVVATAVLHNKACDEKEVPPINNEQEAAINLVNNVPVTNAECGIVTINENNQVRHNLINNYFSNL